jgi:NADPH:quinone reductase-like Zn-dependent oxidoreductase
LIDRSRDADWAKAIYALTAKRGVDVVVDNVGAGTLPMSLRAARKGGRILTVGNTGGPRFEFDNRYMFAKHLTFIGSTMGTRADFAQVMALIFAGKLHSVIAETFALRDARLAHERMEQGEFFGKIVLQP